MIFNRDLIFLHIGKTGGMSCARYLLNNLRPPIYNCHEDAREEVEKLGIPGIIPVPEIIRHCTLAETLDLIARIDGRSLADFAKVVAVIRHPYTLEYSYYRHLQKPEVRQRRRRATQLLGLADGDFLTFVKNAGYHLKDHTQDAFVRLGDSIPPSVELVRFEQLPDSFVSAVADYVQTADTGAFPLLNQTAYTSDIRRELTSEVKEAIYRKHRFMFDSGLYLTEV